jgi:uncharacterized protein (TIGR00730 family)
MSEQSPKRRMEGANQEISAGLKVVEGLGPAVAVFGSARTDKDHPFYKLAEETGKVLGQAGYAVITGGGPGIMEASNKGAKDAGAKSVGLHMNLPSEQAMNNHVNLPLMFEYFFCRKVFYVDPAQAFVVLPGGAGTLDELFEVMTLIKTSKIPSYPLVLAPSSYWQGLVDWLEQSALAEGNIDKADLSMLRLVDTPQQILEQVQSVKKPRRRPLR